MPKAHQRYANTTPATLIARAAKIGPNVAILVERLMRDRPHPEQGYRSALGILSLSPRYGPPSPPFSSQTSTEPIPQNRQSRHRHTPTTAPGAVTSQGKEEGGLANPTLDPMQALGWLARPPPNGNPPCRKRPCRP